MALINSGQGIPILFNYCKVKALIWSVVEAVYESSTFLYLHIAGNII